MSVVRPIARAGYVVLMAAVDLAANASRTKSVKPTPDNAYPTAHRNAKARNVVTTVVVEAAATAIPNMSA